MKPLRVLLACLAGSLALPAAATPLRVATLVPWVGDALLQVPDKATVVATTRRFFHAPPTPGRLDLGDGHAPNLEILVSAAPQLVVADRRWHARLGPRLEASGAEVLWIEAESVEATFAALRAVGRRIGAEPELAAAIDRVTTRLAALGAGSKGRVLALFGAPGSFLVISSHTWLGDLVARLGFEAVVPESSREAMPGYLSVSDEFLAATDPEVVLLLAHGDPAAVARAFEAEWRRIRPRSPRVVALDPDLFATNPGLRLAEAAAALLAGTAP